VHGAAEEHGLPASPPVSRSGTAPRSSPIDFKRDSPLVFLLAAEGGSKPPVRARSPAALGADGLIFHSPGRMQNINVIRSCIDSRPYAQFAPLGSDGRLPPGRRGISTPFAARCRRARAGRNNPARRSPGPGRWRRARPTNGARTSDRSGRAGDSAQHGIHPLTRGPAGSTGGIGRSTGCCRRPPAPGSNDQPVPGEQRRQLGAGCRRAGRIPW